MLEKFVTKKKKKEFFLGNEAIVRGAIEAGVQFVTTYPGTPASEIGNTFYKIQRERLIKDLYFEFSSNEKVALEVGAGASFSGLRVLVAMKHFGVNVASDFLFPLAYSGTVGGMVIVIADDPGCFSSAQSEEDSRGFSLIGHIPTLEPASPKECRNFVKIAFEISEKFEIPVILRTTTRVALQGEGISIGDYNRKKRIANFFHNQKKFITLPPRVLEMKRELLAKIKKIEKEYSKKRLNKVFGKIKNCEVGIIGEGVPVLYLLEVEKELGISLPLLKIETFFPLPKRKIEKFIKNLKKVLIVEELEDYLETKVKVLAKKVNCNLEIIGKELFPQAGELTPDFVKKAFLKFLGKEKRKKENNFKINFKIPKRFPQLCPGCPYWLVFEGIKKAISELGLKREEVVFGGEIGCYMIAGFPPHFLQDYLFCMGSSVGIAQGIERAEKEFGKKEKKKKLISFVGDSSFFHAGIPALINALWHQANILVLIMDNGITAMTGHQPHPGAYLLERKFISIKKIVEALGVSNLKVIDPGNFRDFLKILKKFIKSQGVSVIIAKRPCVRVRIKR